MRVLTDPVETGAVTIALPQDVQAEAYDWPVELFAPRTWRVARPLPEPADVADAAAVIRSAQAAAHRRRRRRALLAAPRRRCGRSASRPASRSARARPARARCRTGTRRRWARSARPGTTAANALAAEADVVIGIGTRWSDFTTASRTAFQDKDVRFVNINVARFDAGKHAGLAVVARRPRGPDRPDRPPSTGMPSTTTYRERQADAVGGVGRGRSRRPTTRPPRSPTRSPTGLLTQGQVLGAVNELTDPRDVVLCAAGSMPGDLHKLWRVRDRKAYHVEYGYSCMGYEVPASLGIRLADETRDVFAMVGDGGYLMMPTELVTAVQERVKVIVVLVQNHGFHSIGSLSESLGSQRFGTQLPASAASRRAGSTVTVLPVDLAANARSLGAHVIEVHSLAELEQAIKEAKAAPADGGPVVIHVETDPFVLRPRQRRLVGRAGQRRSPSWTPTRDAYRSYLRQDEDRINVPCHRAP